MAFPFLREPGIGPDLDLAGIDPLAAAIDRVPDVVPAGWRCVPPAIVDAILAD
jgi:hypothetical protein